MGNGVIVPSNTVADVSSLFNITASGWSVVSAYQCGKVVFATFSGTIPSGSGFTVGTVDSAIRPVASCQFPVMRANYSGVFSIAANGGIALYPSTDYETAAVAITVMYLTS